MSAQPAVTIPRVESWLDGRGVRYETAQGGIVTSFEDCAVSVVDCDGQFLVLSSSWRGRFPAEKSPDLAAYADEHNHSRCTPRVTVAAVGDDGACLQADVAALTARGMDDAQLDDFMTSAFAAVFGFYRTVAQDFPARVFWARRAEA